jgi:2-oxoglutarate ferredoxin oxidoreductase subunit beta
MHVCELISAIPGASYVVRRSVHNVAGINKTKAAIKTAFQVQMEGLGLSLVEVLSSCPTNWHMTPAKALQWIEDAMIPVFPLGDYRVAEAVEPLTRRRAPARQGGA